MSWFEDLFSGDAVSATDAGDWGQAFSGYGGGGQGIDIFGGSGSDFVPTSNYDQWFSPNSISSWFQEVPVAQEQMFSQVGVVNPYGSNEASLMGRTFDEPAPMPYGGDSGGGWWDTVMNKADGMDKWAKDHSTLLGLGAGGLGMMQSIMANKQKEKARRIAQAQLDAQLAARAGRRAETDRAPTYGTFSRGPAQFGPVSATGVERNYYPQGNSLGVKAMAHGGLAAYASGGPRHVPGADGGQSDKVPAMLSDGEFVIDADVVSALGDGSNEAGAKKLDQMRRNIRSHKRKAPLSSIPPKAKAPEQYMKGAK